MDVKVVLLFLGVLGSIQVRATDEVGERNEELRGRNEELSGRNEELGGRNMELRGRNEDLGGQNEELGGRNKELGGRNEEQERRNYEQRGRNDELQRQNGSEEIQTDSVGYKDEEQYTGKRDKEDEYIEKRKKEVKDVFTKEGEDATNQGVKNLARVRIDKTQSGLEDVSKSPSQSHRFLNAWARFLFICLPTHTCDVAKGRCVWRCESDQQWIFQGCHGGASCNCCAPLGCTLLEDCKDLNGTCREWCEFNEMELPFGCVAGDKCKCCFPKMLEAFCKPKPECKEADGMCRSTGCRRHERELRWGCEGEGCWCCVPTNKMCRSMGKCSLQKGMCKTECDEGEKMVSKGCYGTRCKCCVSTNQKCQISDKCLSRGGHCKEKCEDHEQLYEGGCSPTKRSNEECNCCIPKKCVRNKKCGLYKGKCKKWCKEDEMEVRGGCYGSGKKKCRCCAKKEGCHITKLCKDSGGRCEKNKCSGKDEVTVDKGCVGFENCYCCAPADQAQEVAIEKDFDDYSDYLDYYDTAEDYY